jgi:hypoxanthine phosphoribosyltransferase
VDSELKPAPGSVLISSEAIQRRIAELALEIDKAYAPTERPAELALEIDGGNSAAEQPLVLIIVLKGSILFGADLSRALTIPLQYEFVACRSYGDAATTSGTVELVKDVSMTLVDRDVLMVEDIVDTGLTTSFLYRHLASHRPRSLRLVALLDKRGRRQKEVRVDFRGFDIPDTFVVGYGLDLAESYRNLHDIHLVDGF